MTFPIRVYRVIMSINPQTLHLLIHLVDENTDKFKDGEHLEICNLLKNIYKSDRNDEYVFSKYHFLNIAIRKLTCHMLIQPTITLDDRFDAVIEASSNLDGYRIINRKPFQSKEQYISLLEIRIMNHCRATGQPFPFKINDLSMQIAEERWIRRKIELEDEIKHWENNIR